MWCEDLHTVRGTVAAEVNEWFSNVRQATFADIHTN